jgi:hypothetical protein
MKTSFQLFQYKFLLDIAPKSTLWWFNHKNKKSPNQRQDHIFSLCRVWVREHKKLVWELHIGRVKILWANTKQ